MEIIAEIIGTLLDTGVGVLLELIPRRKRKPKKNASR